VGTTIENNACRAWTARRHATRSTGSLDEHDITLTCGFPRSAVLLDNGRHRF
jgi:hypothetical protein